jgi:hypothetical protein
MMSSRSTIVRSFGVALVSLLLCAIFASELPELLSLTDNTANDYELRSADSLVSPVLDSTRKVQKPAIELNISTQDLLLGPLVSPQKTELAPLRLFVLYNALRT